MCAHLAAKKSGECSPVVCSGLWSYSPVIIIFLRHIELGWICHSFLSSVAAADAAKSLQSSPTLCDPIDGSPSNSPVPGILQARTLEWVAISFSNAWKWKVNMKTFSHAQLFATPWTAALQAPLSVGLCQQESWSGVPLPSLPMDCSPPGSSVRGIVLAGVLEWALWQPSSACP